MRLIEKKRRIFTVGFYDYLMAENKYSIRKKEKRICTIGFYDDLTTENK